MIKQVPFTIEQARCHVAALCNRAKVMERKLNDLDNRIADCMDSGDHKQAQELYHKKQNRLAVIDYMRKEVDRMNLYFEGLKNEQSQN